MIINVDRLVRSIRSTLPAEQGCKRKRERFFETFFPSLPSLFVFAFSSFSTLPPSCLRADARAATMPAAATGAAGGDGEDTIWKVCDETKKGCQIGIRLPLAVPRFCLCHSVGAVICVCFQPRP